MITRLLKCRLYISGVWNVSRGSIYMVGEEKGNWRLFRFGSQHVEAELDLFRICVCNFVHRLSTEGKGGIYGSSIEKDTILLELCLWSRYGRFITSIPGYFRRAPCDEGDRFTLSSPLHTCAICIGACIYRALDLLSPGWGRGTKLKRAEGCRHGYWAHTEYRW